MPTPDTRVSRHPAHRRYYVDAASSASSAPATVPFPESRTQAHRGGLADYVRLLRPHQWTKNAFCLAGALFGPGRVLELSAWQKDLLTVAAFCAVSSAIYVLNDIQDRQRDRAHPKKRSRPIASGAVSATAAAALGLVLTLLGAALGTAVGPAVLACLALYLLNNLLYSPWIKHQPLLDVLSIALGFSLRLCAGVYALGDLPTSWILLCTFFLAVFLGFGKRRVELAGNQADDPRESDERPSVQRPVLAHYSVQYLDGLLNSAAIMAVICYALFTATSGKNASLIITVPFVFYAVMHYKRTVMVLGAGEEPDRVVLKDRHIQLTILAWLALYLAVTYSNIHWFL